MPTVDDVALPAIEKTIITEVDLGSSNNRTEEQKTAARQITAEFIGNISTTCLLAFTDGSALENPGPCGAAAVLYPSGIDHHPTIHKKSISKCSTSYHGEMEVIR